MRNKKFTTFKNLSTALAIVSAESLSKTSDKVQKLILEHLVWRYCFHKPCDDNFKTKYVYDNTCVCRYFSP